MAANIIAYGGTFNPLTNAHVKLIDMALEMIKDSIVVVIPTAQKFMKTWKKMDETRIYDDAFRLQLLKAVVQPMDRVVLSTVELEGITYRTYDTLAHLQSLYPTSTIWWMCGDEKCDELLNWYNGQALVETYHFLMFTRISEDAKTYFMDHPQLLPYQHQFTFIPKVEQIESISSTNVRNAIVDGDWDYVDHVCPKIVADALRKKGAIA